MSALKLLTSRKEIKVTIMNINEEFYIRFMAAVTPMSIEKLISVFDDCVRGGIKKIHLLLNSPGGSVSHGLAVYNLLKGVSIEVITYNFGTVDSIGVVMYCAGKERVSVPHARFLLHPVATNFQVNSNIDEHRLKELKNSLETDQNNIARVIADTVGNDPKNILSKIHNRVTLNSSDAKEIGLVDRIDTTLMPADAQFATIKESDSISSQLMSQGLPSHLPFGESENFSFIKDSFTKAY